VSVCLLTGSIPLSATGGAALVQWLDMPGSVFQLSIQPYINASILMAFIFKGNLIPGAKAKFEEWQSLGRVVSERDAQVK
jgi:preprotein translocase subunit SecY